MFLLLSVNCGTRVSSFHNQFTLAVRAMILFRILKAKTYCLRTL